MKQDKVIVSLNAGELSPLMGSRFDQEKYGFGCRTLENFIPLIYGGVERRPGTEYIAGCKSNSAKSRLVPFEHSVDDTYILEFANQVIRVFRSGARVSEGTGTDDISGLDNVIGHWKLNDAEANATVVDADGATHNGTATTNTAALTATGKVGDCFDLAGTYCVEMTDHNDFSFTDNSDDSAFSIICWAYITETGNIQVLLSKWRDSGTTREWRLSLNADRKLQLHLCDESANLTSNLVAHWYLNDDAANTAVDDAVAAVPHDGVASSNTEDITTTGKVNDCFDFAGTETVYITDHAALSFDDSGSNPFSIAAWVYVTTYAGVQHIFTKWKNATDREYAFTIVPGNKLRLNLCDQSANVSALRTSDDALSTGWHFVAVTYDSTGGATAANGATLYVDGAAVASTATNNASYVAMEAGATNAVIGGYYVGAVLTATWQDKIDNVALFNKELTASEVATLWNAGDGTESVVGVTVNSITDEAVSLGWHFLACTYSAPADETTAASGIIFYVDGSAVDSTATNDATYVAMQNGAEEMRIGAQRNVGDSANEKFWGDKIDEVSLFGDVLTPTEIASLYTSGIYEITSPYLTADLFELKFEHSADVAYITHPDYEPRKLSRLGHATWTLEALALSDGPFRNENTDTSKTITPSATTGTITLTATGCTPFKSTHPPNGSAATDKAQTGALFRLVHALGTPDISDQLQADVADDPTATLNVYKGVTWDFVTNGTWGAAADPATIVLERSYDSGTTYEIVTTVTSAANHNAETSGTEESADAVYRARVSSACAADTEATVQISVRDTSHIGIVKIISVESSTSATATVLTTLGSTDLTHRWSEGSWSNYRGWPVAVTISPEERLTFAGSSSKPLTTWGSAIDNWTSFKEGTSDDDAITHTLIGSGQQNRIQWALSKDFLVLGAIGGEHILGASNDEEALTPSNVKAKLKTTYGSKDIAALVVNQAILFIQRGGKKIREFLYSFEAGEKGGYIADDLTVFAHHIAGTGISSMAFQRTPDPMLWCIRNDGQMAVLSYEKDQNVFAWSRFVTTDSTSDSEFESVAVIYGGAGNEDEVWVTVKRTINSSTVRYIERFKSRDWGSDDEDAFFVDCGATYDSTSAATVTATHLKGETVSVYADGAVFDNTTANATTGVITLELDSTATNASKVQYGLPFTSTLKPMRLNLADLGLAVTKKIPKVIIDLYKTMHGKCGTTTSNTTPLVYRNAGDTGTEFPMHTGYVKHAPRGGYTREGDIVVMQDKPAPMTVLSLTFDVGVGND
jgi:hypothetical protein